MSAVMTVWVCFAITFAVLGIDAAMIARRKRAALSKLRSGDGS